jgi:hypothetical protein
MRRPTIALLAAGICVLSVVSIAQAATSTDTFPAPRAVAAQVKSYVNDSAARHHYTWRYAKVECVPMATLSSLHCTGVGRWAFGRGRVMSTGDWDVTTTETGSWTAKSTWVFSGQIGAT